MDMVLQAVPEGKPSMEKCCMSTHYQGQLQSQVSGIVLSHGTFFKECLHFDQFCPYEEPQGLYIVGKLSCLVNALAVTLRK